MKTINILTIMNAIVLILLGYLSQDTLFATTLGCTALFLIALTIYYTYTYNRLQREYNIKDNIYNDALRDITSLKSELAYEKNEVEKWNNRYKNKQIERKRIQEGFNGVTLYDLSFFIKEYSYYEEPLECQFTFINGEKEVLLTLKKALVKYKDYYVDDYDIYHDCNQEKTMEEWKYAWTGHIFLFKETIPFTEEIKECPVCGDDMKKRNVYWVCSNCKKRKKIKESE